MARNDDGDGIAPVRQSYSAHRFGFADALGKLQVGNGFSVRNPSQRIPDVQLKLSSFERQRHIKFSQLAAELRLQLADDFGKRRFLLLPIRFSCGLLPYRVESLPVDTTLSHLH